MLNPAFTVPTSLAALSSPSVNASPQTCLLQLLPGLFTLSLQFLIPLLNVQRLERTERYRVINQWGTSTFSPFAAWSSIHHCFTSPVFSWALMGSYVLCWSILIPRGCRVLHCLMPQLETEETTSVQAPAHSRVVGFETLMLCPCNAVYTVKCNLTTPLLTHLLYIM